MVALLPGLRCLTPALVALLLAAPRVAEAGCGAPAPPRRADVPQSYFERAGEPTRSRHYRILSDLPADESRAYATHLDLMYEEYARRMSGLPQQAPEIPFVMMFAREADYLEVLRRVHGIDATGSGGMFFISPAGAALAFFVESLPRSRVLHVLQHEGFHQFAHSRFAGRLPMWVNEGLAEFFGEAVVVDGRVVVGQASPGPVAMVRRAVEQGTAVDFLRMLGMSSDEWNANVRAGSAAIQYVQAWSMVQFLGWAEDGRHRAGFERFLQLLHAGAPGDRAFVQAFGTDDVRAFESAWRAWARACVPTSFGTAALRLSYLAEGMRELSNAGVRVESLEDLLARLRERRFTVDITVHGRTETLSADESALDIPKDDLAASKPAFELIPPRAPRTAAERHRDETAPMPPAITTRGLEPRELVLRWSRTRSGDLAYELLSPKEAPAEARPKARAARNDKDGKDPKRPESPEDAPPASASPKD